MKVYNPKNKESVIDKFLNLVAPVILVLAFFFLAVKTADGIIYLMTK